MVILDIRTQVYYKSQQEVLQQRLCKYYFFESEQKDTIILKIQFKKEAVNISISLARTK